MADDSDDPWRPGSSVDMVGSDRSWSFDGPPTAIEQDEAAWSPHRLLTAVGVLGSLALAAVVVVALGSASTEQSTEPTIPPRPVVLPAPDRTLADEEAARLVDTGDDAILAGGDVPISMGPADCLHRRLPASVEPRWSVAVPDASDVVGAVVVGADVVVVPVAGSGEDTPRSEEVVALDVETGQERWRLGAPTTGPIGVEYLDVVDDEVFVVSRTLEGDGQRLSALSAASGELVWETPLDRLDVVEVVETERFLVIRSTGESAEPPVQSTSIIDLMTGDVESFRGRPVTVDDETGLLVTGDDEVVYAQFLDATTSGRLTFGVHTDQAYAVVGTSLIVEGSGVDTMVRRSLDPRGPISVAPLQLSGSVRIDPPELITGLLALDDASAVVLSDDAVHGANVGENVIEIRWRVAGRLAGEAPSDRGRTLIVRRDGGRLLRLVDSSTGRSIVDGSSFGNEVLVDDLHANGVVVHDDADSARVAYDLDGQMMWTLPGSGPLAVGDRVVVDPRQTVAEGATSVELSAFGPTTEAAPSCRTTAESFQGSPP